MPRRSYRYDPVTKEMVEITNSWSKKTEAPYIQGDITAFKSPIDGTIISDRGGLRRHMKKHDVVNPLDYKEHFKKKARERELRSQFQHPEQIAERKQAASDAFERVRNQRIADGTWGKRR